MKKALFLFLTLCPLGLMALEPDALKEALRMQQQALVGTRSEEEKSQIFYELALLYYEDQEVDKAFAHFLEALKYLKKDVPAVMSDAESSLYLQAFDKYVNGSVSDPIQRSKELLKSCGEIADQNPDYLHLNFLIATAHANLGQYNLFFHKFYRGYPSLRESFLAYKTQGILYLRLSQHSSSFEERYAFKEEAFRHLTLALERNPCESGLYKILIFLAKDEKNDELVLAYLQRMVEYNTPISRSDIYLYVREAVILGEFELGQRMVDQARSLYGYSRALVDAEEYLNLYRG